MPKDNLLFLGSRIRSMRKKCGLTQQALADQCGLAVKTIQDIEKGRKNPSSLFPAKATPEDELTQRVMGKLRLCSEENQRFLLRTMDFLAEELLTSQPKTEPDGSK